MKYLKPLLLALLALCFSPLVLGADSASSTPAIGKVTTNPTPVYGGHTVEIIGKRPTGSNGVRSRVRIASLAL